jgi:hypothetical protein
MYTRYRRYGGLCQYSNLCSMHCFGGPSKYTVENHVNTRRCVSNTTRSRHLLFLLPGSPLQDTLTPQPDCWDARCRRHDEVQPERNASQSQSFPLHNSSPPLVAQSVHACEPSNDNFPSGDRRDQSEQWRARLVLHLAMSNEESGPNRDQRAGPHPTGLVVQRQQ